jgi:putative acetyltransferase
MLIRIEEERDWPAVHALNVAAFETSAEANLVDALRRQARPLVSVVAEQGSEIVGHILFSPVTLADFSDLTLMGLAPMAVAKQHQRQGIGSALVRAGIDYCRELGFGAVVVLGHPEYYPRFGFQPASAFGLTCEYNVPDDVFMAMDLQSGYLSGKTGAIAYHTAFSNL